MNVKRNGYNLIGDIYITSFYSPRFKRLAHILPLAPSAVRVAHAAHTPVIARTLSGQGDLQHAPIRGHIEASSCTR